MRRGYLFAAVLLAVAITLVLVGCPPKPAGPKGPMGGPGMGMKNMMPKAGMPGPGPGPAAGPEANAEVEPTEVENMEPSEAGNTESGDVALPPASKPGTK